MTGNELLDKMKLINSVYVDEVRESTKKHVVNRKTAVLVAAAAVLVLFAACGVFATIISTAEVKSLVSIEDEYIEHIPDYIIHEPREINGKTIPINSTQFAGGENKDIRLPEIAEEYGFEYTTLSYYACKKVGKYFLEVGSFHNSEQAFAFFHTNVDYFPHSSRIYVLLYNEEKDDYKYDRLVIDEPGAYAVTITAEPGWKVEAMIIYFSSEDESTGGGSMWPTEGKPKEVFDEIQDEIYEISGVARPK